MNRRKTAVGIAVLLALALNAFAAASASAATGGTTAFTCVKDDPSGPFYGEHCLSEPGGSVKYKHVAIKQDETTTGTVTNSNTAEGTTAARSVILKGTIAGVTTELTCPEVHGEGSFENKLEGEEHYALAEGRLHFTGCEVKMPSGKGCKVSEGTLTSEQLSITTKGQGMGVKLAPKEGTKFMDIKIEGCSISALNNTFPVTGSVVGQATGATVTTTHAETTAQNTLKFGGAKAGFDAALTDKAHSKAGEETHPLVTTTAPFTG